MRLEEARLFWRLHYGTASPLKTVRNASKTRFLLVQMAIKRVRQYREGYEPLVESRNKEAVTALREIAAGKIFPEDMSQYRMPAGETQPDMDD